MQCSCALFLLHSFHVAPFRVLLHVALFLCCTHFVFDFIRVALFYKALFSSCTFFVLYPIHVAPFCVLNSCQVAPFLVLLHVPLTSRCTFFVLHSFRVAVFSYWTLFKFHYFCVVHFSCCTLPCCTFFILHHFWVVLFSCCAHFVLHFFCVALFSCCTLFMLHFSRVVRFRVVLFQYYTFFLLNSFHVALIEALSVSKSHNKVILQRMSGLILLRSEAKVFCKKGALGDFAKFTRKHLRQSLVFNKVAGLRQV